MMGTKQVSTLIVLAIILMISGCKKKQPYTSPQLWSLVQPGTSYKKLYAGSTRLYGLPNNSNNPLSYTTNGGASWKYIQSNTPLLGVNCILERGSDLFANGAGAQGFGFYRSSDNGVTWVNSSTGLAGPVMCLCSRETDLFAYVYDTGVYKSTDNGITWTAMGPIINFGSFTVYFITAIGPNLIAGTEMGIFKSKDDGITWTPADQVSFNSHATDYAIVGSKIYVSVSDNAGGLFVSLDNGNSWKLVDEASQLTVVNHNGKLYSGTNAGVYWQSLKTGNIQANIAAENWQPYKIPMSAGLILTYDRTYKLTSMGTDLFLIEGTRLLPGSSNYQYSIFKLSQK